MFLRRRQRTMMMMAGVDEDWDDLQAYATRRDEVALTRVIRRHADFVYQACLRQVRDPGLAEDAAQAVFIVLAKKAGRIRQGALVGWLFNVARYASHNALRSEKRRRKYEKEAAVPANAVIEPSAMADDIGAVLDKALARLADKDRQALLLRFFRDRSLENVAATMGTTAEAAKMRIRR